MRCHEQSFVIGFDTEFYYDDAGCRHVLSYQFAFIVPDNPAVVHELIVFASSSDILRLSFILNFILEHWDIPVYYGWTSSDGFPYRDTRTWCVPVLVHGALHKRTFWSYDAAVSHCDDPAVLAALQNVGERHKTKIDWVETSTGRLEAVYTECVNGYPIGYINNYSKINKYAIPVTLVSHFGNADLTTLAVGERFEKDLMVHVSAVQGGLVSLSDVVLHNPQFSKYWNVYPLNVCIRDTMCYSVGVSKSLDALGRAVGIPKISLPSGFTKDDMLSFMINDIVDFCDYAVNDSLITLIYSGELWGYNKQMPVTITSAATKVAVPVISHSFGFPDSDRARFDYEFRGLVRVGKGKAPMQNRSGYIENSTLEPVSLDAKLLQDAAQLAYKGGYNACIRPGYYRDKTYDFDLHNAYPTCMSLVPDIDWSNPIAFEGKNQILTSAIVPNPFVPLFAYVSFEFPKSVRFPCIPMSKNGCLVYPRTSRGVDGVYASAPELFLALKLGATVTLKRYWVGAVRMNPDNTVSHSLFDVVKQFISDRDIAKLYFGVKSLMDLLLKLGVNGLYGKISQDVIDKHTWSAMSESMVNIGGSALTSPTHACMITAGVRAVLLAAMNQVEELGYRVFSVTTDGFISDVPYDVLCNLDLYGFTRLFRNTRYALTGSYDMWEVKHVNDTLLNLTTRGNVAENENGVLAHNSYVTEYDKDSMEDRLTFFQRAYTRVGALETHGVRFENFKNLSSRSKRKDFSSSDLDRFIKMDFDMKRKPVQSSFTSAFKEFITDFETVNVYDIACFDTVPYDDIDEFVHYKSVANSCTVLATEDDWAVFFNKINAVKNGSGRAVTDMDWSMIVSCVMAVRLGIPLDCLGGSVADVPYLSSTTVSVADKIDWINKFNSSKRKFTLNTWKDCRKSSRQNQMLPSSEFHDLLLDMMYDPANATV